MGASSFICYWIVKNRVLFVGASFNEWQQKEFLRFVFVSHYIYVFASKLFSSFFTEGRESCAPSKVRKLFHYTLCFVVKQIILFKEMLIISLKESSLYFAFFFNIIFSENIGGREKTKDIPHINFTRWHFVVDDEVWKTWCHLVSVICLKPTFINYLQCYHLLWIISLVIARWRKGCMYFFALYTSTI